MALPSSLIRRPLRKFIERFFAKDVVVGTHFSSPAAFLFSTTIAN
jgi:hypothetical protein